MRIALKKDGKDIPNAEKNNIDLSIILFLFIAETIPIITPTTIAIMIDDIANTNVFLNVEIIMEETDFSCLTNDLPKAGNLATKIYEVVSKNLK